MRSALVLTAALAPLALGACARAPVAVPEIVKPYRITIQQGNYVTREMVEQLKPGMTKEQVRFILGTPLVTDIFHADRWDYVFYREAPGGKREQRNFAVIFEDGRLARVIGDLLPSEPAQAGTGPAPKPQAARPEAPKSEAEKAEATKPEGPKAEAAKPESGAAQSAPQPASPGAMQSPTVSQPPAATGNWRAASDPPAAAPRSEDGTRPAGEGAPEQPKPEPATPPQAEEKPTRGFFGRLLERIGF